MVIYTLSAIAILEGFTVLHLERERESFFAAWNFCPSLLPQCPLAKCPKENASYREKKNLP